MTLLEGFWECQECHERTSEPHTAPDGGDVCEACCEDCRSGAIRAWQEQVVKEQRTAMNPGDLILLHGIPSREQSAVAEWRKRSA